MKYISEKEYNLRMKKIQSQNVNIERMQSLKKEQNKYRPKIKLPSTTKLMAVYLFVILNVVLTFAMVTMYQFRDLTYLGVLITDVAAQILTFLIYTKKSLAENSQGGIVYDLAMKNTETNDDTVG